MARLRRKGVSLLTNSSLRDNFVRSRGIRVLYLLALSNSIASKGSLAQIGPARRAWLLRGLQKIHVGYLAAAAGI